MPGVRGVLPLAMVGTGGQVGALALGVFVVVGSLFGLSVWSGGHWVSWQGRTFWN